MHLLISRLIGTGSGSVKVFSLQATRTRRFGDASVQNPSIENTSICVCKGTNEAVNLVQYAVVHACVLMI